jgi:predicted RNase H-like HicB family nuclease
MTDSEITLSIHLEVGTRRDGNAWVAWCLPLDVLSQGATKSQAISSLKEAVELWFESCLRRNVLDQALVEAGFKRAKEGETIPSDASVISLHEKRKIARRRVSKPSNYITVSVPAYTARHAGATC